jgi:hypothetical protein
LQVSIWSPDGKRIYYTSLARDRESIWSVGAAVHAAGRDRERDPRRRAPDGRTLAFLRDEQHGDIVGASALWLSTPSVTNPVDQLEEAAAASTKASAIFGS